MADRLVQLVVSRSDFERVTACLREISPRDWWAVPGEGEDARLTVFVSLHKADAQDVIDRLSDTLEGREDWRLYSVATESNLPEMDDEETRERLAQREVSATREEIYSDVRSGAALTRDYLILSSLATCVAAIGLNSGQVAVVIGAMVIAPLLGPIMAFAFGTALGNLDLLRISARSLGAGIAVSVLFAALIGQIYPASSESTLLDYDGVLSLRTVILPLASGAAAALTIAGGSTSGLIGVMVAAALLPPLAAFGLLVGSGNWSMASRALVSVAVNVIAINLAAQVVFVLKGIRPRRWKSEAHATSVRISLAISALLVIAASAALWGFGHPDFWSG
ncbi:TIGR00341 family protein [Celeribacter indicus]|uniref:TIGR00341 family protein n=1 Tax=Celeribacter indicus TaxID=1208324 RepID=A0A0B5DNK6_9RHOB|nr:TIGR00341 family protein [Celeribacter indicus]AJE44764.1 hypothetical protein P73_0049 [Celeribacter indicus]SDX46409.1 TIGR00341 family protein [Celeribacter indicus]